MLYHTAYVHHHHMQGLVKINVYESLMQMYCTVKPQLSKYSHACTSFATDLK